MNASQLTTKNFLTIDENEVLSRLIGKLLEVDHEAILIFNGKNFLGIFDKKKLIKSKIDITSTKIKHFVKKVPLLKPEQEDVEVARLIASADVRALPVFEGKELLGVVHARTLLDQIKNDYAGIQATRLMKQAAIFGAEDEIGKAIQAMHDKKIDRAPVTEKDGSLIGVVSLIDLITRYHSFPKQRIKLLGWLSHQTGGKLKGAGVGEKQKMLKLPIKDVLSPRNMIVCEEKDSIKCVIQKMVDNSINSIIIAKNNRPTGIITVKDILMDYSK